ncbi:SsrA-binding protein [Treponema vincentii ATCC 35580]|nr:SsrA-binding protein [Treponema vincentii ATCC 35580]
MKKHKKPILSSKSAYSHIKDAVPSFGNTVSFCLYVDKYFQMNIIGLMDGEPIKIIAKNKKAHFDYSIEETIECGIALQGTEIKSVRDGRISFPDSFAEIIRNEVWLKNFHISEYVYSSIFNHDPDRPKKLLLHKDEIKRLTRKTEEKGYTLIPLEFYLKRGRIKVMLGICKGKKQFDKRADIKERDIKRDMQRELHLKNR